MKMVLSDRDVQELEAWEQSGTSCNASQGIYTIFLRLAVMTFAGAHMWRNI